MCVWFIRHIRIHIHKHMFMYMYVYIYVYVCVYNSYDYLCISMWVWFIRLHALTFAPGLANCTADCLHTFAHVCVCICVYDVYDYMHVYINIYAPNRYGYRIRKCSRLASVASSMEGWSKMWASPSIDIHVQWINAVPLLQICRALLRRAHCRAISRERRSVLQCVAVCCSVLQSVAECWRAISRIQWALLQI